MTTAAVGTWPRVTVIVPVLDDEAALLACLGSLRRQTYEGPVEIIVADNGSGRDPRAAIERIDRDVRVVREPRPGSYAARNAAVEAARGSILAFTDADCLPEPGWLGAGVAAVRDHGRCFVGGRVDVFAQDELRPRPAEVYELARAFRQEHLLRTAHHCVTANMLVATGTFHEVGPFSEVAVSGGDREWGERATSLGVRGVYAHDAVVRHPARPTVRALVDKTRRVQRGLAQRDEQEGRTTGLGDVARAVVPPVRSVARWIPDLPRPRSRTLPTYLAVAGYVHYVGVWERFGRRRSPTSAGG